MHRKAQHSCGQSALIGGPSQQTASHALEHAFRCRTGGDVCIDASSTDVEHPTKRTGVDDGEQTLGHFSLHQLLSFAALYEFECQGIETITKVGWRRTVIEYMTKM